MSRDKTILTRDDILNNNETCISRNVIKLAKMLA